MMNKNYYEAPKQTWWQGRNDGKEWLQQRWWQVVETITLGEIQKTNLQHSIVLAGFSCDEGVARNKGRVGAASGPEALRYSFGNLPIHFSKEKKIYDVGNVVCKNSNLEEAQEYLSTIVSTILERKGFPVLLGGGHEILYGHYLGVRKTFPGKNVGVINFDAHFDLRSNAETGATSGTGFYQIAEDCKKEKNEFLYFALGIQESGNTRELFERATQLNAEYILARDLHFSKLEKIKTQLQNFLEKTDAVCLTIDLDVFVSADAPGVSAPSANGLRYDLLFYEIMKFLSGSGKIISMDIAELNPQFDIDNRTAKLAANIIFDWVKLFYESRARFSVQKV
jgi:formiminoglutamase